jgi:hypothetical protein
MAGTLRESAASSSREGRGCLERVEPERGALVRDVFERGMAVSVEGMRVDALW